MLFQGSGNQIENLYAMRELENRKLTWKDLFKRELFRQNLTIVENLRTSKKKDIKQEQEKRAAARVLSKLFQKKTIYLEDDEQQYPMHGHYSAFIPLSHQVRLNDELQITFPYIEYLVEKGHTEAKTNVYNEISNCIRSAVDTNTVDISWRSCLRKYMSDLDTLKAVEIYVELLKKGTNALAGLHKMYGNQCSMLVFFHRVCQSVKYFRQSSRINKNLQSSVEIGDQISEVTLPKTSKYLFCSICLLYDCNQHNIDDTATQNKFNFQYVASKNIIPENFHLKRMLKLITFQKKFTSGEEISNKNLNYMMDLEEQEQGQMDLNDDVDFPCSGTCYQLLNKETFTKKSTTRRPIISLLHRSQIHMAIDIFSYDPCTIAMWIGKDSTLNPAKQPISQQTNKGVNCENIFFYLIEEYDLSLRIRNQLYKSEVDYLLNQSSRPKNQVKINPMIPNKKKKNQPRLHFDHGNNQNYRIGCCFHYFLGQEVFDHNCERCCCKRRGFCLKQCQCPPSCQIRRRGCTCKGKEDCRNKKCDCFQANQECIPGVCSGCFDTEGIKNKKNACRNAMIQKNQTHYIRIGDSNIYGLGAFAGQDINKDDLVIIYSGEIIEHQVDYLREGLRYDDTFYNFAAPEGGSIDARYMGNKSRFINHGQFGEENLNATQMFAQGKFQTVLYAKRNIKKGEELFFHYDPDGNLCKNFPGKYHFIKPEKKGNSSAL